MKAFIQNLNSDEKNVLKFSISPDSTELSCLRDNLEAQNRWCDEEFLDTLHFQYRPKVIAATVTAALLKAGYKASLEGDDILSTIILNEEDFKVNDQNKINRAIEFIGEM